MYIWYAHNNNNNNNNLPILGQCHLQSDGYNTRGRHIAFWSHTNGHSTRNNITNVHIVRIYYIGKTAYSRPVCTSSVGVVAAIVRRDRDVNISDDRPSGYLTTNTPAILLGNAHTAIPETTYPAHARTHIPLRDAKHLSQKYTPHRFSKISGITLRGWTK